MSWGFHRTKIRCTVEISVKIQDLLVSQCSITSFFNLYKLFWTTKLLLSSFMLFNYKKFFSDNIFSGYASCFFARKNYFPYVFFSLFPQITLFLNTNFFPIHYSFKKSFHESAYLLFRVVFFQLPFKIKYLGTYSFFKCFFQR